VTPETIPLRGPCRLALLLALPALLAAAAGCSARATPSRLETRLADAAKDVVIPLEAENARNPTPNTPLTLAQGREVFQQRCAFCHSSDGHSHNPVGLAMYPPAMDLTSPHVQSWSDAELYWIIENGIRMTGMPGWQGIVSRPDAWKLTRYVHALPNLTPAGRAALDKLVAPPPPPRPPVAAAPTPAQQLAYGRRLLHQEGCLMCHAYQGSGEDMAPDLTDEAARGRSPAWLIGHFKDPSAFSPESDMPAFRHLTRSQLQALVTLLEHSHGK
jgi:mono/diheme cytochrome c family protein